jgi:hypothetical protein
MMIKLLLNRYKTHIKSCSVHINAERNVPDLSRWNPDRDIVTPRGLVTRQPSLLAHLLYADYLLCANHLLQFYQVYPVLLRARLYLRVYHHLQHHHASNKSNKRAGGGARECIQKPIS